MNINFLKPEKNIFFVLLLLFIISWQIRLCTPYQENVPDYAKLPADFDFFCEGGYLSRGFPLSIWEYVYNFESESGGGTVNVLNFIIDFIVLYIVAAFLVFFYKKIKQKQKM